MCDQDSSDPDLTQGALLGLERPKPEGRPNVIVIALDDVGFGQLGCFGSTIETPNIDRLASEGLRFNRFHVTAMCSPTRAAVLTGRNAHRVGMGFVADVPLDFPGYTARIPRSAATVARHLKDAGWATRATGKWHLVPRYERSDAGPFENWPLGLGFERYYGFLLGDTNHWRPTLVQDNHYVAPPSEWPDGYHLTEDLVSRALREIDAVAEAAPGKPTFSYLALGVAHAPHHAPQRWIDHYRGAFDKGWDTWRDEVVSNQRSLGVIPPDARASDRPSWVDSWDSLSSDEQRMNARQQEVFAAFLSHADEQIGRLIEGLESRGVLDDTIIVLFSDNGASAEGGKLGSVNEHRFTTRVPESLEDNLEQLDHWGGPETYNHYSWGWAWAGNAPFRLWKRFTWLGGTRTPLIIRYPAAIADPGAVREQVLHAVDLAPTLLDLAGVTPDPVIDGVEQLSFDGQSFRSALEEASAPTLRTTQYFELLGSRSIIHNGFKATTNHVPEGVLDEEQHMEGSRSFESDHWELFDLEADFAEVVDLSTDLPDVVTDLEAVWLAEADRNGVLPLFDTLTSRFGALLGPVWPAGNRIELGSGSPPLCDEVLPLLFGGFTIAVELERHGTEGVLCSLGDHLGGFALFLEQGHLNFTLATPGRVTEIRSPSSVTEASVLSVTYDPSAEMQLALLVDGAVVATALQPDFIPATFQHGGTTLRVGLDTEFCVSKRYEAPNAFDGQIGRVVVDTAPDVVASMSELVRNALHAD
jgi:arylsulfatase